MTRGQLKHLKFVVQQTTITELWPTTGDRHVLVVEMFKNGLFDCFYITFMMEPLFAADVAVLFCECRSC